MRNLALVVTFAAAAAHAQAIDGTLTVTFEGWKNGAAIPIVRQNLTYTCSLTCTPSAPTLNYRSAGIESKLVEAPTETVGRFLSSFGDGTSGTASHDSEQYEPGVAFRSTVTNASCYCGGAIGQSGFKDIVSGVTAIPAYVVVGSSKARVGREWLQRINGRLRGSESVEVTFSGGGVDKTVTLAAAEFAASESAQTPVTPTVAGMMTVTAKFQPYGVMHSNTVEVQPADGAAAGGGGAAGGSAGGGAEAGGCSVAGGLVPLLALAVLVRRRRR